MEYFLQGLTMGLAYVTPYRITKSFRYQFSVNAHAPLRPINGTDCNFL